MAKRPKREALVHQHLQRVSRSLLEKHQDIVRKLIGRNSRIYALYRKGKLYYVGLADGISSRLKAHLRDGHRRAWDQFSIFLTIRDQHIKEIESLLLQIATPPGNAVGGRSIGSKDMLPAIKREVRLKQKQDLGRLFGRRSGVKSLNEKAADTTELKRLFPNGARLRAMYKGKTYRARLRKDGKIWFNKELFGTLGSAARKAAGRPKLGWRFWRVERGKGYWVRLHDIRKAGTPVLPN